jgi:hypothetical protein
MTSIPLSDLERNPSASFTTFGDKYVGRITAARKQQQTDPNTGQPKSFPSGDPIMLLLVTIQPETGDPITLWAKGGNFTAVEGSGTSMMNAITSAARAAGAKAISEGDELAVAFTGLGEARPPMSAPKLYTAAYKLAPATPSAVPLDDLFSTNPDPF